MKKFPAKREPEICPEIKKAYTGRCKPLKKFGAGDGDRTRDVQLGKLAFYR
jgi:hypothetical protein